ncbi:hypothetical protein N5P32_16760 [Marinomonas pontica]|uniref:hypothetical protein n=1 Tax=Marinomonas pontica TaxID=264739 RepID=UPI00224366EB|nr:hypothetical protein [Marinomonas pontica]MCW8357467.1 hypothetical protein [Marinomonas pontica]
MNTPHSSVGAPRKELINRLQKGVVALIFLLILAFNGMYLWVSQGLEKQHLQQQQLSELQALTYSAKAHWQAWLLRGHSQGANVNDVSEEADVFYQALLSEYRLIESRLPRFTFTSDVDFSASIESLNQLFQESIDLTVLVGNERAVAFSSVDALNKLDDILVQSGVSLEYHRQLFSEHLLWGACAVLLAMSAIILLLSVRFARQLRSGLAAVHTIIDHHKHNHASVLSPRSVVDELTDLGHQIDNELASRDFDLAHYQDGLSLVERAFDQVDEAFLVTNHDGDVNWLSAGAERLWFRNTSLFESMFGIDSGLDDPVGERISDSILLSDDDLTLNLSDGIYVLSVKRFASDVEREENDLQRFISIRPKSELVEFDVLHHSLKLMVQDVWDAPIRPLRSSSPYAGFAKSLENIRRKVSVVFDELNAALLHTNSIDKVTKLQQIASLIDEKTDHNNSSENDLVAVENTQAELVQSELSNVAWLSEQIRDSLILGYELVLQRLALVEKDLSSDVFLLSDVERCLNEVRAGVLTSLAATEGESETIRHRFAVDLQHDIGNVQSQIESMKSMAASTLTLLESDRSVGVARLDKARASVNEMLVRVHGLMEKSASNAPSIVDESAIKKTNDEWE